MKREDKLLDDAKRRLYPFMLTRLQQTGRMPTIREMVAGLGLSSTSLVAGRIDELVMAGWVDRDLYGRLSIPGVQLLPLFEPEALARMDEIGVRLSFDPAAVDRLTPLVRDGEKVGYIREGVGRKDG